MNNRGVSVTLNFAITLAIAAILLSTIMMATASLVEDQRDETVRAELTVIGERVAASLMSADRLARSGADTVEVLVDASPRAGHVGYEIYVNSSEDESILELEPENNEIGHVEIAFRNQTAVERGYVPGGSIEIRLNPAGELEVRSA